MLSSFAQCGRRFFTNSSKSLNMKSAPKAAVCITGNEVLTGKILDKNTNFIAKLLFSQGVSLVRTEIIVDEVDEIVDTINRLRSAVGPDGFIFTSGGIGPTHDDVTYEGVAKAFGRSLELHQPTVDGMKASFLAKGEGQVVNAARERMAMLPQGCEVLPIEGSWVPFVKLDNVFILPGIPSLLQKMMNQYSHLFHGPELHRILLQTMMLEGDLAGPLAKMQEDFPDISLGSYIRTSKEPFGPSEIPYRVKISIEGTDLQVAEKVAEKLMTQISAQRMITTKVA